MAIKIHAIGLNPLEILYVILLKKTNLQIMNNKIVKQSRSKVFVHLITAYQRLFHPKLETLMWEKYFTLIPFPLSTLNQLLLSQMTIGLPITIFYEFAILLTKSTTQNQIQSYAQNCSFTFKRVTELHSIGNKVQK